MAQLTPYEQSLTNILRTVVNSSWPLYEHKLERNAEIFYPGGSSIIALRNVAIQRLRQIFNHVNNPNQLFTQLRDVQDQGVSSWFTTPVHYRLISDVDLVLDQMYETLKNIEHEIKRLERKLSYVDFISDLFYVVSRDISGGALELRHRISQYHYGQNAPNRVFYKFNQKSATKSAVVEAAQKRHQGNHLTAIDYLDVRGAIGNLKVENGIIDDWLNNLFPIYEQVAQKYAFHNVDDMFRYLRVKQNRNADSHYSDWIQNFYAIHQNQLEEFVNTNVYLRGEFDENETNLLELTFERCQTDLRAIPRLFTGSTITVIPRNNQRNRYNAYFMREMDPVNNYRIAKCIVTTDSSGERRREAKYWAPRTLTADDIVIEFGHRVPEDSNST